jgi:hypothetical protein
MEKKFFRKYNQNHLYKVESFSSTAAAPAAALTLSVKVFFN